MSSRLCSALPMHRSLIEAASFGFRRYPYGRAFARSPADLPCRIGPGHDLTEHLDCRSSISAESPRASERRLWSPIRARVWT